MRPILILCLGILAITVNDLLFKFFSGDYSLHQLVFMRTVVALVILLPVFISRKGFGIFKTRRPWPHLIRVVFITCANLIFFTSLAQLPLGETTAIVFLAPLLLTGIAWFFLGEQVGAVRWLCILCGFSGTMLIMKPFSDGFDPLMLMPLIAAFLYASFNTMTRLLRDTEPAERLASYTLFGFFITSGLVGLFLGGGVAGIEDSPTLSFMLRAWQWPSSMSDYGFIVLIGICSGTIALAFSAAYRSGEVSQLAPFEYLALPLSALWGYSIWGEVPGPLSFLGMTLIIGAGIFLAYREIAKGRKRSLSMRSLTTTDAATGKLDDE